MFWPFTSKDPTRDLAAAQQYLIDRKFAKSARLFRRHKAAVAADARLSLAHARAEMLLENDSRAWRLFRQAIDLAAERGEVQVHANALFHFSAFSLMTQRNAEALTMATQARALFERINLLPEARAAARLAWTARETA